MLLGLPLPETYVSVNNNENVHIKVGVLTKWFISEKQEYTKGSELLTSRVPDYAEEKHNLEDILEFTSVINSNLDYWVRASIFDALIGNSDRHHENWGILDGTTFAPLFDNGTSLNWRTTDERLDSSENALSIFYKKFRYKMTLRRNDASSPNVEQMISFLRNRVRLTEYAGWLEELDMDQIREFIVKIQKELNPKLPLDYQLTETRCDYIYNFLYLRKRLLIEGLG